jgi:hypothetical protein
VQDQIKEVQPVPEIVVPSSGDASPSSISESITPPELPIRKVITRSSPFHITAGKLSLEFELEGSSQHEVTIEHAPTDTISGHTIDVEKMVPGDSLHVARNKEKDQLVFTLCYGADTSLQVVL